MAKKRRGKPLPEQPLGALDPKAIEIVQTLTGYFEEAREARSNGFNPRDDKWEENLDLYWNRFDFSKKADWQSKAVLPEVPQFVDRFAAAMNTALLSSGDGEFYTVIDPADKNNDIARVIKRVMKVWLSCCAVTPDGHKIGFSGVFQDLMKLGAIMSCAASVGWHKVDGHGYPKVELHDPRRVWIDHTMRNLYRVTRNEVDKHRLIELASKKDSSGKALYDLTAIEQLAAQVLEDEKALDQKRLTGSGVEQTSNRKPIVLDEWLCDLVDNEGKIVHENVLCVVANDRFLIRGPEANPFWHGKDWTVVAPLVSVPLSPYGRSFMENFGSLARLFNDLTNLIMDAVFTSSMKAFAASADQLEDPTQLDDGIHPNKLFKLENAMRAGDFMAAIDLGTLSPDAVKVWSALKDELREAASLNEIGVGQLADKGRTSAYEIGTAQQNSSEMIQDLARRVESHILEPLLDLIWKTGLQHLDPKDQMIRDACGSDAMFQVLLQMRKDWIKRPITFQCRGISGMVARRQKLQTIVQFLGMMAQNEIMLQAMFKKISPDKLLDEMLKLADIDVDTLSLTEREMAMQSITGGMPQANGEMQAGAAQPVGAAPGGGGAY